MRPILVTLAVCSAASLATPAASAATCYLVLDANNNVVYQDIYPPVDLSDDGAAERSAMRARNEHMIAMESDRCPRLEFVGVGAGTRINLEEMGQPTITMDKAAPAAKKGGNAPPAAKPRAPAKSPAKPAPAS